MDCPFILQTLCRFICFACMKDEKPTIIFDGICKLCNASVNFILKRDKKQQFRFVPQQSEEGKILLAKFGLPAESKSVIFIRNNSVFTESDALIAICKYLPVPWKWLSSLKIIPKNGRNMVYRWVAKNRYRWFGKRSMVCQIKEGNTGEA